MTFLNRTGVFKTDSAGAHWVVKSDSHEFHLLYFEPDTIMVMWDAGQRGQKIKLDIVDLKFGRRLYFLCPWTGERCLDLYLAQGRLASAKAFGLGSASKYGSPTTRWKDKIDRQSDRLLGLDGKGPARGRKRAEIAEALARTPYAVMGDLQEPIAKARRASRRAAKRPFRSNQRSGPFSTAEALRLGSLQYGAGSEHGALPRQDLPRLGSAAGPPLHVDQVRGLAFVEDHPALDVRVLAKAWDLSEGLTWNACLAWPSGSMDGGELVYLTADFRDPNQPLLVVRPLRSGSGDNPLIIRLTPSHPNTPARWFMVCPITGKRSDLLFWRDGVFGCATAQRLRHRSQRAS